MGSDGTSRRGQFLNFRKLHNIVQSEMPSLVKPITPVRLNSFEAWPGRDPGLLQLVDPCREICHPERQQTRTVLLILEPNRIESLITGQPFGPPSRRMFSHVAQNRAKMEFSSEYRQSTRARISSRRSSWLLRISSNRMNFLQSKDNQQCWLVA